MKEVKETTVKYPRGHSRTSKWAREDMFCSYCGVKGKVWSEQGCGDYYDGNRYVCTNCGSTAYEPMMYPEKTDDLLQIYDQLKDEE